MRRSLVAAAAVASLLVSALPGSALAMPNPVPGVLDQSVVADSDLDGVVYYDTVSTHLTQTSTPGHSGVLTYISLYCKGDGTTVVTLTVGSSSAHNVCNSGYQRFNFASPPSVTAGTPFTFSIDPGGASLSLAYTVDTSVTARAADGGNAIETEGADGVVTIASFSFQTYLLTPPTTSYTWSPTSVTAGQSTTATLTAVTHFAVSYQQQKYNAQANGFAATAPFTLKLAALPAWFTPTGIQCDAAITNCTIEAFSTGLNGVVSGQVATDITVTLTGTAAPPSDGTDNGGQASGQGCNTWSIDQNTTGSVCATSQSVLGIVGLPTPPPSPAPTPAAPAATPTPAPTLPPTTTSDSRDGGPSPALLLWTLPALLAAAAVVLRRLEADDPK